MVKRLCHCKIPIGEGPTFKGVVDVAKRTAYVYENGNMREVEVPAELADKVEEIREMTVEAAAEGNDTLLEKYLDGQELTLEEILSRFV